MNDLNRFTDLLPEAKTYIQTLFGGMPPGGKDITTTLVHALSTPHCRLQIWRVRVDVPQHLTPIDWQLTLQRPLTPPPSGSAILLSPDACWPHVIHPEAAQAVLAQGVTLAHFDRLHLAHDRPDGLRGGALYTLWPKASWGAVSAWAWGLQHSAQALRRMPEMVGCKIGVIGHSRSGKAALLAGACDPTISLTVTHNSGCAGAASFQVTGDGAETLAQLQSVFPHWLGQAGLNSTEQAHVQEIDNTALLASVRGRHVCVMQADDDLWANPSGTRHAVERLRAQWQAQGNSSRLTYFTRSGGHAMSPLDWSRAAQTLAQIQASE